VDELRAHHDEIYVIAERHGMSNVRVFGSVARGEATENSDLDLLIDVGEGRGYFAMSGFALDIEELLGVFTQVATVNGLKKHVRDRVLAEAVAI
jgi:hypothetical protein